MRNRRESLRRFLIVARSIFQRVRTELGLGNLTFFVVDQLATVRTDQIGNRVVVKHAETHLTNGGRRLPTSSFSLTVAFAPAGF